MQLKLISITATLATYAFATIVPIEGCNTTSEPASSCTPGPIQCCETVECANIPSLGPILSGLGIVLLDLNILVGLSCTPMDVIGGTDTSAQPVCCEDNDIGGGIISIGCVPVDL
ncbi:fungal hydrophobin [Rhodocollybia butyracea]|uniref:Hydrophobin n=1 Tax=Rhodocollybia butyracea TaxID=206335 RepID=A0A9P5TWY4_9AGAR|nr:fungal hydrophobin [Rhodocollybia butyracea]